MSTKYEVEVINTQTIAGDKDVNIYRLLKDGKPIVERQSTKEMSMIDLCEEFIKESMDNIANVESLIARNKLRLSSLVHDKEDVDKLLKQKRK